MVTVKSSQKIFTDSEVASLTGICVDHLHNFAPDWVSVGNRSVAALHLAHVCSSLVQGNHSDVGPDGSTVPRLRSTESLGPHL